MSEFKFTVSEIPDPSYFCSIKIFVNRLLPLGSNSQKQLIYELGSRPTPKNHDKQTQKYMINTR